tara:strand:+ start:312 stop:530 length:219 start_codon:yes stop_codon:yes gene_type:complete
MMWRILGVVMGDDLDRKAEVESVHQISHNLAVALHRKHFPENQGWEPDNTTYGLILQIDNMTTALSRSNPTR